VPRIWLDLAGSGIGGLHAGKPLHTGGDVMAKPFRGVINVDVTQSVPDWEPYTQPIAPEGTPSVLYIVLDDVGYSAMGARSP
jgi:hypothetical protein